MPGTASQTPPPPGNPTRWNRGVVAAHIVDFEQTRRAGISQRAYASGSALPRATLQDWMARKGALAAPAPIIDFFESPHGVAFLHRMVVAAHLVMTLMGNCGLRTLSRFFELAGLGPFLANSYGSHHAFGQQLHQAVRDYGKQQRRQLAAGMPTRKISLCPDETFPTGGPCLVAIEPVSNFIIVETYADKRDAMTWGGVLDEGLDGIDVTVEQVTSDEAKALIKLAKDRGARRGPDLFHVLQPINKGCVLALARRLRLAQEVLQKIEAQTAAHLKARLDYDTGRRPRGRRPHFETRIGQARAAEAAARAHVAQVEGWRTVRADAVAGLAASYHPYDVKTGAVRTAEVVRGELSVHFEAAKAMVLEAGLAQTGQAKLDKAHRMMPSMVAAISDFHSAVRARLDEAGLSGEERGWVSEHLLPAWYLHRVAHRSGDAATRQAVTAVERSRLYALEASSHPWWSLSPERRAELEGLARDCADLFQRSSSCVEGRNGQLSLFEHSTRGLSGPKLEALTVIHNFFSRRSDGTTAAERFFGTEPDDLFECLVGRLPMPARPAKRRKRERKTSLLQAA